MCQSKESDFTVVADSRARHFSLSPLVFSCCGAYQLGSTTEFPLLRGFWQSLAVMSPLHSTLHLDPWDCIVWGRSHMLAMCHPVSSNSISPYNFCTIIFLSPAIFPQCWRTMRSNNYFHQNSEVIIMCGFYHQSSRPKSPQINLIK